jgi:hypothetical protein
MFEGRMCTADRVYVYRRVEVHAAHGALGQLTLAPPARRSLSGVLSGHRPCREYVSTASGVSVASSGE